jgi:hypothetical protein
MAEKNVHPPYSCFFFISAQTGPAKDDRRYRSTSFKVKKENLSLAVGSGVYE